MTGPVAVRVSCQGPDFGATSLRTMEETSIAVPNIRRATRPSGSIPRCRSTLRQFTFTKSPSNAVMSIQRLVRSVRWHLTQRGIFGHMRVESIRRSGTAVQNALSFYRNSPRTRILLRMIITPQSSSPLTLCCKNTSEPYTPRNVRIVPSSVRLHASSGAISRWHMVMSVLKNAKFFHVAKRDAIAASPKREI